jgi:hypothetical protein
MVLFNKSAEQAREQTLNSVTEDLPKKRFVRWSDFQDHPYELGFALLGIAAGILSAFGLIVPANVDIAFILAAIAAISFLLVVVVSRIDKISESSHRLDKLHDKITWKLTGQVVQGADDIKKKFEEMHYGADELKATWSALYKDTTAYFEKEKKALNDNKNLKIQRLINPETACSDDLDYRRHLADSKEYRAQKRYTIRRTTLVDFDLLIAGKQVDPNTTKYTAMIVFNDGHVTDNKPILGLFLDPLTYPDAELVSNSLYHWFLRTWKEMTPFEEQA